MRKILALISVLLILVSCSKKYDLNPDFQLETYRADMSGYKGLKSTGHHFLGTMVSELKRTIKEKESAAFVLSRTTCKHCQLSMRYLNEVLDELGLDIYYIDGASSVYPIVDTPDYHTLDRLLKSIEEENDEGVVELQTPHFFTVYKGEFQASIIGWDIKGDEPTDAEIKALKAKYTKALEPFVK